MRPLLARAKCSGTVPFLLLRPPYCRLNAPTPMFCFMYTFLASDAASIDTTSIRTWRLICDVGCDNHGGFRAVSEL